MDNEQGRESGQICERQHWGTAGEVKRGQPCKRTRICLEGGQGFREDFTNLLMRSIDCRPLGGRIAGEVSGHFCSPVFHEQDLFGAFSFNGFSIV